LVPLVPLPDIRTERLSIVRKIKSDGFESSHAMSSSARPRTERRIVRRIASAVF
jgi:hypothetical protein